MSITLSQYFGMNPSDFAMETKYDAALVHAIALYKDLDSKERKYEVLTLVYHRNSAIEKMNGVRIKHANLVKAGLVVKKAAETHYDLAKSRLHTRESELECGECRGCESEAIREIEILRSAVFQGLD